MGVDIFWQHTGAALITVVALIQTLRYAADSDDYWHHVSWKGRAPDWRVESRGACWWWLATVSAWLAIRYFS